MWQAKFVAWTCSLVTLFCYFDSSPGVATIQTAYEREESAGSTLHDKGLRVLQTQCDDGKTGRFLCQVVFISRADPTERLYFDVIAVARKSGGWELQSGLCKPKGIGR